MKSGRKFKAIIKVAKLADLVDSPITIVIDRASMLLVADDELQWKITVGFDRVNSCFTLALNETPFLKLPYQASITFFGPTHIVQGSEIKVNDKKLKIDQYSSKIFYQQLQKLLNGEKVVLSEDQVEKLTFSNNEDGLCLRSLC